MTNSPRNFKKEFILEVMPNLIVTIIYHLMDEKKHASIRSISLFVQIHSIFLFCLREFPELVTEIESHIKKFIAD